jgi:hypothetical protein
MLLLLLIHPQASLQDFLLGLSKRLTLLLILSHLLLTLLQTVMSHQLAMLETSVNAILRKLDTTLDTQQQLQADILSLFDL